MKFRIFILCLLFIGSSLVAQDSTQTFLSVSGTAVDKFHELHPEYDGRGTIILVLDTGVDMGIDGLTKTSTGEVKVIDVQDFTGEGDVKLYEAEIEEENDSLFFVNEDMGYKVYGADQLKYKAVTDEYFIGAFDEWSLINSSSHTADLNGNGSTNDKYTIVAFETEVDSDQFWVVYMDTNDDGDLSDEQPHRNYKDDLEPIKIPNESGLTELTMGINIFPEENRVSLHFDDGFHGTHVAGIASGYQIGGIDLNGIAPGAKVISLKLGDNLYSGGATVTESMKKAYLYADKISKKMKEPCVINMSFGIGSEIEGEAEMESFIENLCDENPYLYISLGSGNEGPGISSIGLPSASYAVFASGAVLPVEVGRDLFGTTLNRNIILYFSSRGGEVSKPDVVSPGACTSTVPNWMGWDRFWGTSMASPYSAGVMSVLLSAAVKDYPGVKIPAQLLYKAIREGAVHMEGYNHLDEGHGYINVMNAYKILKKYIDDGEIDKFETYSISSTAPNFPGETAPNLYLRNGSYLKDEDTYVYSIRRNNFQNTDKFYRAYNLKSDSGWLIPIQKKTYIRNDQPTFITVKFNHKKMQSPGLYTGRITAYRNDKTKFPEFEMLATVVIPYRFCAEDNYSMKWKSKKVEQGLVDHYFIELPAGQTGMDIKLSAVDNDYARVRFRLFDPDGIGIDISSTLNTLDNRSKIEGSYFDLKPGVYELDVEGHYLAKDTSTYNLAVQFNGINRLDHRTIDEENNSIDIVNLFNQPEDYNLTGKILGYKVNYKITIAGSEKFELPFVLRKSERSKEFKIEMSKKDFNKFTDLSLLVYDENGLTVESDALSFKTGIISVTNNSTTDSTEYVFTIVPGFADESGSADINLTENTYFKNDYIIGVYGERQSRVTLYPSLPKQLNISFDEPNEFFPNDSVPFGKINFESSATKKTEYELPINFKF